jgi:hypothetical protein
VTFGAKIQIAPGPYTDRMARGQLKRVLLLLASADELDAKHIPATPDHLAPAAGSPGHERDIELTSNFYPGV